MDDLLKFTELPHRRWNPLLGEWVLVSPQRTQRPWQGQLEAVRSQLPPQYDPHCYLCPGNDRAGGHRNPVYENIFVFENDFAALLPESEPVQMREGELLIAQTERGICRVVCFSPRHDLTISSMSQAEVERAVRSWKEQYADLSRLEWVKHIQVFENRGEMMGASNPHPHCQIWANAEMPNIPAMEANSMGEFARTHRRCLLCAYAEIEERTGERIVCENDEFLSIVPFWAVWPFEVLVLSRRHVGNFADFNDSLESALADILRRVTARYDNLFCSPFPYSMGFHQQPPRAVESTQWHFHAHYFPPLLRSAEIRKFIVGYELLAGPQRDITPETAAKRLRSCSEEPLAIRPTSM